MSKDFDPFATETETMRLMKEQLARELEPAPGSYQEKKEMKEKISRLESEKARLGNELYNCIIERDKLRVEKAALVEALEELEDHDSHRDPEQVKIIARAALERVKEGE